MEELIPVRRGLTTVTLCSETFLLKNWRLLLGVATNGAIRIEDVFYPSSREIRIPFELLYDNEIS